MPLVKTQLFLTLLPAVQKAAEQAMTLYNRGLDPLDKEKDIEIGTLPFPKIKVSVDCSRTSSPLLNTSNPSDLTVDPDKVAELFGVAFAYNMVPVLINEFTDYFKDATITIPPGQPVNTVELQRLKLAQQLEIHQQQSSSNFLLTKFNHANTEG